MISKVYKSKRLHNYVAFLMIKYAPYGVRLNALIRLIRRREYSRLSL